MFGNSSSSSPFGQQAPQSGFGGQQQQPQGQQQQGFTPQQQQTPSYQQHQQQPLQSFGQSQQGAFSNTPQQPPQQHQQGYPFGPGGSQQQTPQQQQPWASQSQGGGGSSSMNQGWNPAPQNNGYDQYQQQGMMASQNQQQYGQQQQQPYQQQQPMQQVYLPGYLSKIRGQRPYSAAASRKVSGEPSPPKQDDAALNPGSANAGSGSFSTPNTRSSREGNRRGSLDGGPSSPLQGFTSSFFSSPSSDYPSHQGRSTFDGSSSIFGAGGLRGGAGRKSVGLGASRDSASTVGTPGGRERSSSYMRASSVGSPQAHAVEDDDAPPFEALADVDASRGDFGAASFGDSVNAMATSPPSRQQGGNNASGGFGTPSSYTGRSGANFRRPQDSAPPQSSSQSSTIGRDSSLCTLLLYGFPSSLSHTVLSHFGSIGEITSHVSLAPASASDSTSSEGLVVSECLRIVYAEPWHALRALRRSGELVAGVAYVGVRWADDMLHQEMLMNGINSNAFLSAGGSTIAHSTSPPPGVAVVAKSSNSNNVGPSAASASASAGAGTGAGARTARDSTPSFGRPITMVDSPAAALRARTAQAAGGSATSSPFSKAMGLFGGGGGAGGGAAGSGSANTSGFGTPSRGGAAAGGGAGSGPGTPGNQSGVMGRIGDAIFGW